MDYRNTITVKQYVSPIGCILLGSVQDSLVLCDWQTDTHSQKIKKRLEQILSATYREGTSGVIEAAQSQLEEYFSGKRQNFDLHLALVGTDFQKTVWKALLSIPYGETVSYAALARIIGKPKAVRAVANANNANALSVVIPCHRVIGSNRTLTGYGGGLDIKLKLLELETKHSLYNLHENRT